MEFSHPFFQQGHPYLLDQIKRKIANPKATEEKPGIKIEDVNKVLTDVKLMKNRQENLDSRFGSMKQENEALWREIAVLRQKHMKQQQIVNKLIQFLVTIVQPQRTGLSNMGSMKRRYQLMINDAPEAAKIRRKNEESTGPIIHELTEELLDNEDSESESEILYSKVPHIQSPSPSQEDDIDDSLIEEITSPISYSNRMIMQPQPQQEQEPEVEPVRYIINEIPKQINKINPKQIVKTEKDLKKKMKKKEAPKNQKSLLAPKLKLTMPKIENVPEPSSTYAQNVNNSEAAPAQMSYTNQHDFINAEMPHDLFEDSQEFTVNNLNDSPLIGGLKLQGGAYQSNMGESSNQNQNQNQNINGQNNNWAVAQVNNNEVFKLNSP